MDLSIHDGEIPIPISSNYVGGSGSDIQSQSHNSLPFHHHHPSNVLSLPIQTPTPLSSSPPFNSKQTVSVKYRECLKNHAAAIGGNATDGCGEFMPSGEEGTLEALKCSACNCHRNFHRKEIDGDQSPSCDPCFNFKEGRKFITQKSTFGPQNLMKWKEGFLLPWSRKGSEQSLLKNRRTRCFALLRKLGGGYRNKKRVWCKNYAMRLGSREEFSRFGCITTSITWPRRPATFSWSDGNSSNILISPN